MKEAILRLENLLEWSARLGSDEIDEIKQVLKLLNDEKNK